jgi:hypothetical protein
LRRGAGSDSLFCFGLSESFCIIAARGDIYPDTVENQ